MERMVSRLVGAACLGLGSLAAQAAGGDSEDDAMKELQALLNTPVVSASKRAQSSLESPQAVEVLTGDQIRASGAFRLMDLLKLMTNVQVTDQDGQISRVSMRGVIPNAAPKTIQVLVDGVALYNAEVFPLDIESIPVPLDAIDRVELVRGPSSSLYGANAQLGVIAITTRRAEEGFRGAFRLGRANNGGARGQAAFAYGTGPFRLSAGAGTFSNHKLDEGYRVVGTDFRQLPENQYHQTQLFVRPEVVWATGSIWAAYGSSSKRTGPETNYSLAVVTTPAPGLRFVPLYTVGTLGAEVEIYQAGWSQTWSEGLKSTLKVNHTFVMNGLGNGVFPVAGNPQSPALVALVRASLPNIDSMENLTDYQSDELALQVNWDLSSTFHLVLGGDTRQMQTPGSKVQGIPSLEPTASGAFVSADWNTGPAVLSMGFRAENETLGGSRTSPRLAIVVPLDATSAFRAGYFTSTRSPQMTEMFASLNTPALNAISIPNRDLKPEEAVNVELGYRKTFEKWSLDLTLYQMKLKKFIASVGVGTDPATNKGIKQFQNAASDLTNKGLELTLRGEIRPGWLMGFNGAYVDYKDEARGAQQYYTPKTQANLWTRMKSGPWFAYAALQHTGGYTRYSLFSDRAEDQGSMAQVNFNLGYEFARSLSLSAYGINASHAATPSGAAGIQNQFIARYARKEVGLQGSWRF